MIIFDLRKFSQAMAFSVRDHTFRCQRLQKMNSPSEKMGLFTQKWLFMHPSHVLSRGAFSPGTYSRLLHCFYVLYVYVCNFCLNSLLDIDFNHGPKSYVSLDEKIKCGQYPIGKYTFTLIDRVNTFQRHFKATDLRNTTSRIWPSTPPKRILIIESLMRIFGFVESYTSCRKAYLNFDSFKEC